MKFNHKIKCFAENDEMVAKNTREKTRNLFNKKLTILARSLNTGIEEQYFSFTSNCPLVDVDG